MKRLILYDYPGSPLAVLSLGGRNTVFPFIYSQGIKRQPLPRGDCKTGNSRWLPLVV